MSLQDKTGAKRGRLRDAGSVATLFALAWLPFTIRMVQGKSALSDPLVHDVMLQWIPFRAFISRALAEGVLPLWSPHVFAGFPFQAFSHSSVFYPLAFMLNMSEYARAVNFFYPLHLCIAASGVYALCRAVRLSPGPSLFAAASYAFTGKPFYFIHFLPSTCSNVWMPWFLFSAVLLIRGGRPGHFMLSGMFLALQVLGGDVESTSYGLLLSALALPFLCREARFISMRVLISLSLALILAALLCAVQALPLLHYAQHFVRNQGVTFSYFSGRTLPLELIWGVLLPTADFETNSASLSSGPSFYLGVLTLALALFAAGWKARSDSRALFLIALLALFWSFGSLPVIDRLQFLLPVLNRFGTPEHAFFMGQLFMAVLAGQGLQRIMHHASAREAMAVLFFAALVTGLGALKLTLLSRVEFMVPLFVASMLLAALLRRLGPRHFGGAIAALFVLLQLGDVYVLAVSHLPKNDFQDYEYEPWLKDVSRRISASHSRYIMVSRQGPRDPELVYHAGMALDMDAMDGWITVPPRRYAEFMALADERAARFVDGKLDRLGLKDELKDGRFIDADGMPVLDLVSLRYVINRGMPLKFCSPFFLNLLPPDVHKSEGDPARPLLEGEPMYTFARYELFRFLVFANKGDVLTFLAGAAHGDQDLGPAECHLSIKAGFGDTVMTFYHKELETRPRQAGRLPPREPQEVDLSELSGREIRLEFIKERPGDREDVSCGWMMPAVINPEKPFWFKGSPAPGVLLYENREALPRAFLCRRTEVAHDDQELLEMLNKAGRSELHNTVFLSEPVEGLATGEKAGSAFNDSVELVRRRSGEEVYQVRSGSPGLLFMANQYYPGWRAFVQGVEKRILRADYCMRAAPVDAGSFVVRLVYEPRDFKAGLFISLASWAALFLGLALLLAGIWRGRAGNAKGPRAPSFRR